MSFRSGTRTTQKIRSVRFSDSAPSNKDISSSNRADITFIEFLLSEYGNVEFAVDLADSLINFAKRFKKNSKRYQSVLTFLKFGIPATLLTTELLNKIKQYRKIKSGQISVHNEKERKIAFLIGDKTDSRELYQYNFVIGRDVVNWLITEPKTKLFKILGYYEPNELNKINNLSESLSKGAFVLIEYKGFRLVWDIALAAYNEGVIVRDSVVHGKHMSKEVSDELRMCFFKEFVNHFNVRDNVIYVHSSGIYNFPRKSIPESPFQFDVIEFEKEIDKVLSKGKKRAVVFVGVPGVGKSTVIKKLEATMTGYPMVYCTPDCFSSTWGIQETFSLIQYIQPCIVIMEDMDSYDFRDKKKDLGVFLDEMDDVNGKLKAFFIATINDTSLVHYSLINRPGRFDQVHLLETPKDAREVYSVMKTRYEKNKEKDSLIEQDFFRYEDMDRILLSDIIANKFTHADICEIVEKALLIEYDLTLDTLRTGYQALSASKKAIASCNFSGQDPRSVIGRSSDMVEAAGMPTASLSTTELNFKVKGR